MPELRRAATSSSSHSSHPRATTSSTNTNTGPSVRRNLFHQHLSRRPTTSSTSTSVETLRLDNDIEVDNSDIVIRDQNGEFQIDDVPLDEYDELEEGGGEEREDEKEKQRLSEAVKHHQRDRNRAPSEPAELLEAVKASLRSKVATLADDNWMYEAEEDIMGR